MYVWREKKRESNNIDPCITPDFTRISEESWPQHPTYCYLFVKSDQN